MGLFDNLFKSETQRQIDSNRYYEWAYPFGEAQQNRINNLILDLIVNIKDEFAIYNYLVCRQELAPPTYDGKYQVTNEDFIRAKKKLKKTYNKQGRLEMSKYMALVEADLMIDENLNYPCIEQLNNRALEIKKIID